MKGDRKMNENYSESLDYVSWADNESFPDFLWNPMFGVPETDNYYETSISASKLSSDVTSLRRKYTDYFEWETAIAIWREYMQDLVDQYGSVEVVIDSANEGTIDAYVPVKPKLKPTKRNQNILKTGIVPVRTLWDTNLEDVKETAEKTVPFDPEREDQFNEFAMFDKIPDWAKKSIDKATKKNEERRRIDEAFNGLGRSAGVDFISSLLEKIQEGDFDFSEKSKSSTPIKDRIEELEMEPYKDEDIDSYNELHDSARMRILNGRKVREEDDRAVEFVKDLYELGIDIVGTSKETIGHVRLARKQLGYDENPAYMTRKELKKYKKKMKKEKKWQETAKKNNHDRSTLEWALLNNRRPEFVSEDSEGFSISLSEMFGGDD